MRHIIEKVLLHHILQQIEEMAIKCVATGNGSVGFFKKLNKDDVINIFNMSK